MTEYHGSQMKALDSFSSIREHSTSHIQLVLDLILKQEVYINRAVDAFSIHRYLLDITTKACFLSDHYNRKFYLKHADEKGDPILIHDKYNTTGIMTGNGHTPIQNQGHLIHQLFCYPLLIFMFMRVLIPSGRTKSFLLNVLKLRVILILL